MGAEDFANTFKQFEFKPGVARPNGANCPNESVFGAIQPDTKFMIEHVAKPC